ncbi:MAG TPA: hypothetical protein VIL37_01605 [Natronosporangium sp.]
MSTPTVLPAAALATLAPRPAPSPARLFRSALARGAGYLVPVPLAVAATEPLSRLPWTVPVGALAAGWCAALGLLYLAAPVAERAGPGPAARLVLAGFAALAGAWSGLLALAPAKLVGADRPLAHLVSLAGLAVLAALAVARATGTELAMLGWSLPVLLVAGATITGWPAEVRPAGTVAGLAAGIAGLLAGAATPALRRSYPATGSRPTAAELRGCAGPVLVGLCQVAVVLVVARAGQVAVSAGGIPPALVPLLVTIPGLELWVGWHLARVSEGLTRYDEREAHLRYVRRIGWATLAALLPPLAAGTALAGTAGRLPYGLSAHPDVPALVLALASGVLLAGVVATGWLLAARRRFGLAALVTGAPVVIALGLSISVPGLAATSLSGWGQLLPSVAVGLAAAYAAGLILAAFVLFDTRSLR